MLRSKDMILDIKKFLLEEDNTIATALEAINQNGYGVIYIVKGRKLLGVITDGDIRRYILKGQDIYHPLAKILNTKCKKMSHTTLSEIKSYMQANKILSLPIVDPRGKLERIEFSDGKCAKYFNGIHLPIVIMAGGKGTRLYPYTEVLPKPLIPINEKTITEHIIDQFLPYGCEQVYMIVNYKKNLIKTYFKETNVPYEIQFIDEEEFCGTGGGIKLVEPYIKEPFFLTNCDILVDADYAEIVEQHKKQKNIITMVCADKKVKIPYGIVEADQMGTVCELREKPEYTIMTNTGLYLIEPQFLDMIPSGKFIHITDVIARCIKAGKQVGTYVVGEEAWLDMGQFEEIERMKSTLRE